MFYDYVYVLLILILCFDTINRSGSCTPNVVIIYFIHMYNVPFCCIYILTLFHSPNEDDEKQQIFNIFIKAKCMFQLILIRNITKQYYRVERFIIFLYYITWKQNKRHISYFMQQRFQLLSKICLTKPNITTSKASENRTNAYPYNLCSVNLKKNVYIQCH